MNDSYNKLLDRLGFIYYNKEFGLNYKMKKILDHLVEDITIDTSSIIADRIVSQYEETKGDITFGVVVENANSYYLTYILIFEKEKTYSNVLLRKFDKDKIMEAKSYFLELKDMIVNNDLSTLSNLIVDKLQ